MGANAMFNLSYGLFVLSARVGNKDNACVINTVTQVTAEPNRISIAVNKANYTHDMIFESGKFTVSIISEAADFDLFKHFGFQTGREVDKFAGYADCERAANGDYYVTNGVNAYISASVFHSIDLGTHTLFIADVTEMKVLNEEKSATYAYYHASIKPQPQARPADQVGDESGMAKTVWRCKICGYEYEGETLPEGYVCPLCKHPASDFERV